jgi:hypothetical protein
VKTTKLDGVEVFFEKLEDSKYCWAMKSEKVNAEGDSCDALDVAVIDSWLLHEQDDEVIKRKTFILQLLRVLGKEFR